MPGWIHFPKNELPMNCGLQSIANTPVIQANKIIEKELTNNMIQRFIHSDFVKRIILYFRQHSWLPNFIILIIQAGIEIVIFFDLVFDLSVAENYYSSGLPLFFVCSSMLIVAPYFMAWSVCFGLLQDKIQQHRNDRKYFIFTILFIVSPIAIGILLINDIYHVIECVFLKPIYYVISCGRNLRVVSFEELGYYKLRRVSEIFGETILQALLQLWVLTAIDSHERRAIGISTFRVVLSFVSSVIVLILWIIILFVESRKNGMTFSEYITVVFRGSFDFIPYLPAITRGGKNGEKVNWIYYGLTAESVGAIAIALINPKCRLNSVKISSYSIKKCSTAMCRYFGKILASSDVHLIVSQRESHIKDLFQTFDSLNSGSFSFEQFARVILVMRSLRVYSTDYHLLHSRMGSKTPIDDQKHDIDEYPNVFSQTSLTDTNSNVTIDEVIQSFDILADKYQKKIWLLDMLVKLRTSGIRLPCLDYDTPLYYAVKAKNEKMISLLIGNRYEQQHRQEYEHCVIECIVGEEYKLALMLCENKGIPVVVYIRKGYNISFEPQVRQRSGYPTYDAKLLNTYVSVSMFNIKHETDVIFNCNSSPKWNHFLLFVVPFEKIDTYLEIKHKKERLQVVNEVMNITQRSCNSSVLLPTESNQGADFFNPLHNSLRMKTKYKRYHSSSIIRLSTPAHDGNEDKYLTLPESGRSSTVFRSFYEQNIFEIRMKVFHQMIEKRNRNFSISSVQHLDIELGHTKIALDNYQKLYEEQEDIINRAKENKTNVEQFVRLQSEYFNDEWFSESNAASVRCTISDEENDDIMFDNKMPMKGKKSKEHQFTTNIIGKRYNLKRRGNEINCCLDFKIHLGCLKCYEKYGHEYIRMKVRDILKRKDDNNANDENAGYYEITRMEMETEEYYNPYSQYAKYKIDV